MAAAPDTTASSHIHEAEAFYSAALCDLHKSGVPFLVGGAYALREHADVHRDTKDLDVFCKEADYPRLLADLSTAGYETDVPYPWWLTKARRGEFFVDIIFRSGNGLCPVDDGWFQYAPQARVLGHDVKLTPAEETLCSKVFVQTRERFDGADVNHLIRARGKDLDWRRVLTRMGQQWEVLLGQLINFRFVYPMERSTVPTWVMQELLSRVQGQLAASVHSSTAAGVPESPERLCRGTLLSDSQYEVDLKEWGYADGRPEEARHPCH